MTHQVRKGYRNHRRATWGLAIVLVIAIAAVVIPIASGAADKTYTMQFGTTPVTPTPPTTGNSAAAQTLCAGNSYTSVQVQITNTAKSSSLGSANVTFPTNVTLSGTPSFVSGAPATATISRNLNVVSIRELSLAKTGVVTISVALSTPNTPAGPLPVTAVVKQSNDFNDSGQNPDANIFATPATFPTLDVQTCTAPISGKVYLDRDSNGSFGVSGSSTSDVPKQGWSVTLSRKTGTNTYTQVGSTSTDANGDYSLTGQIGSDHKVCVTASTADSSGAWGLREPTGNTVCGRISTTSDSTSAGALISGLSASGASGLNFGVVPVTGLFGATDTATTSNGDYSVTAATTTTKPKDRYVQETWNDGGKAFFTFSPLVPCTQSCGKVYLLETLTGEVDQSALSGKQARLLYDDVAPYQASDYVEMPYCKNDPRPADWGTGGTDIITTDILPTGATSCIVVGTQEIIGGATPKVAFSFLVFTSFDGGRGVG